MPPPDPSPADPIYVTRPHLPPLAEVIKLLEGVWERRILTNGGPLHQQLEQELCAHLGVEHLSLFANGTLALLVALKALRLQGEVITTPFSFVATSEALSWNGLEPVFADIDPRTFCLDPASIEASITPRTSAILAVHCYGFPCDVEAIQRIADDYNLRGAYRLPREAVITAFEGLLALRHLHLEQEDLVRRALGWHRQGMDFADALHLARSEGCGALISFDRQLVLVAGQLNHQPTVKSP